MEILITGLVAFLALMHLAYAIQNVLNLTRAGEAVAFVLGQVETPVYPHSMMPLVKSPVLIWTALIMIIGAQFGAGAALAMGSLQMFMAGGGSPAEFAAACEWALIGCGIALLLWFGLFLTIGAALFQMWQTPLGQGAMGDATRNGVFTGLVMLILLSLPAV